MRPFLLFIFCSCALSAASIDFDLVDNPHAIRSSDRAIDNRFQDLFAANPHWLSREIASIARSGGDQSLTMLAARLLYRGEPWTRRADDTVSTRFWRERNVQVRGAILRQLRFRRDKALAEVYVRLLERETEPELILSALLNLRRIDQNQAKVLAVRLADPSMDTALPGAQVDGVREKATDFLADPPFGPTCQETMRALSWALLRGGGAERLSAVRMIPRGELTPIAEQAALRLIDENRQRPLAGDDAAALILLSERLRVITHADLAAGLMGLAEKGPRPLASAAATALGSGVSRDITVATDGLAARAQAAGDPALHNALLELLVRLNPESVRSIAGPDSPWTRLAEHRQHLQAWEWEGMLK